MNKAKETTKPADKHTTQPTAENKPTTEKRTKKTIKNIPALTFEDAIQLAIGIWECASGQKVRRLTLFDHLHKSPDSGPSRALITASSKIWHHYWRLSGGIY